MSLHPVHDAEELARALDAAPIEMIIGALVRRGGRLCGLAEAAYHESVAKSTTPARVHELAGVAADSARRARDVAEAVAILAPYSPQDNEAAGYARFAGTYDRLTALRVQLMNGLRVHGEVTRG